jgi:hypothetical protein
MIVVIISSLAYYLTFANFNISSNINSNKTRLEILPLYLKKFKFDNELIVKCIKDGRKCLIYSDGSLVEELEGLFQKKPTVYTYNKKLDVITYDDIELKKLDRYEVCFEFHIDKYNKYKDMIVETTNKVYIFNSFYPKPIVLEYLSDVNDYFDDMEQKVRDVI